MFKKGYKMSDEHKKKISEANKLSLKGKHNSPKTEFKKGFSASPATQFKKGNISLKKGKKTGKSSWNKGLKGYMAGTKSPHWKGGITPLNQKIRTSLEYKLWRTSVFERDNWTCVWCFERGGELNADHIKPFALFPELRLALDNGRTLCKPCHLSTETYGGRLKIGGH
jgi:hypothetical protein